MLNRINLDDRARGYMQSCLKQGDTYAHALLNASYLGLGAITTFLPKQLNYSNIDFSKSVYLATGIRIYDDTRNKIYEMVNTFLREGKNRYVLLETYYNPNHLKKMTSLPDVVFYGNEIYFLLSTRSTLREIRNAFSSARDYPFICGLLDSGQESLELEGKQDIPDVKFDALAQKTLYVIVGAFDNEGYLVWEQQPFTYKEPQNE